MSRIAVLACALLLAALPLRAQQQDMVRIMAAELHRLDSLHVLKRALEDSVAAARRPDAQPPLDTVALGPVRVIGQVQTIARDLGLIRAAWEEHAPHFRNGAGLEATLLLMDRDDARLRAMSQAPGTHALELHAHAPLALRRTGAEQMVLALLNTSVPADVRAWLGTAMIPAPETGAVIHRRLLLADHAASSRRCYAGDAHACVLALGLADPGAGYSGWYTPDDLARVTSQPGAAPPLPLGTSLRAHFLTHVIERHPQLLERMSSNTTAALAERIAAAAGVPLDSLAADWQRTVVAARHEPGADQRRTQLASLVWVAVFIAFATRSTRWRFG